MELNEEQCYRAMCGRDARFDGRFFIGVKTTGIYCRPICPSRTPRKKNVDFLPSAAAAEEAGFRACRRCRPETAPGTPAWNGTSATVSRALRLIEDGVLDRESVEALAQRLGMGARQLRRLFRQHLGTTPRMVARTRRAHLARGLLDTTALPMSQIAHASGFRSIRRFNEVMRVSFGCAPSSIRRNQHPETDTISLRIPVRPPLGWEGLLRFLRDRAIPGVEQVDGASYQRTVRIEDAVGTMKVEYDGSASLELTLSESLRTEVTSIVAGVRRLFDIDADAGKITSVLRADAQLARHLREIEVVRVAGAFNPFEVAVRAVLGQQISVKAATTLAGRLVVRYGERLDRPDASELTHTFPSADRLANARLEGIGLPKQRARTIRALSQAVATGKLELVIGSSLTETLNALAVIPGVGPWTANYLAMRVFREPDAFPAGDLVLRKILSTDGEPLPVKALERASEQWRPWRAYVALALWQTVAEPTYGRTHEQSAKTEDRDV